MEEEKRCPLFRKRESLSFGKEFGYCDMDGDSTTCQANTEFCEKPDALRQYLQERLDRFEKKRAHPGDASGKLSEGEAIKATAKSPLLSKEKRAELNAHAERRRHPRYLVRIPLDFWQTPDVVQRGLVTDMSEGGLGFESMDEIQTGAEIKIRVYLSKEKHRFDSIEGTGKIMWRTVHQEGDWRTYKYGMSFMEVSPESRNRLMKYILMLHEGEGVYR
ncbi:MAG: PilZ domain-containing protein [Thermodesulfobacteriota bacterium]